MELCRVNVSGVFYNVLDICRDTAGQERFRTITTAYYRGAMVSEYKIAINSINIWCDSATRITFLLFLGHHARLRHHQREVFWKYQELDKKHRGGQCLVKPYIYTFIIVETSGMLFLLYPACVIWCWKDGSWQQVWHQWQAAGVQRQRGEGEKLDSIDSSSVNYIEFSYFSRT